MQNAEGRQRSAGLSIAKQVMNENMNIAYLFSGQGAQHVGMGKDLYDAFPSARRIFDLAQEISSLPLKKLCFEGPEQQLARTDIGQPAIFTVSAAVLAVIDDLLSPEQLEAIEPEYVAGLSLGEYTALYAAGVMDFETCLKLVTRRGQVMQEAATARPSGLVSLLGLDEAKAIELCRMAGDGEVLTCANFNCPGQIVLSGELDACRRAAELAKDFGALGAVPLKVAGAFHSEIMAPAAEKFAKALESIQFDELLVKVVANVDGRCYEGCSATRHNLISQLVKPVRWQHSMELLLENGVDTFYEIGPGRVLTGLMKRINRRIRVANISDAGSLKEFLNN